MFKSITNFTAAASVLVVFSCSTVTQKNQERSYINIVGSSTVSTFATSISEEFSRTQHMKNDPTTTPMVSSTGTTYGFELFCSGVGYDYPDFVNASREIQQSEIDRCARNGIEKIIEIKIGHDGIVFGQFIGHKKMSLNKNQIFLALAEKIYDEDKKEFIANPYKKWSDINPSLPKTEILIYGPPETSGTRDVLEEMVMETACINERNFVDKYPIYEDRKQRCHAIRKDGAFVESGENDDTIIKNLRGDPDAIGIVGYNFLVANSNSIRAVLIDDVSPTSDTIASKKYPLSRPLFIYFKKEHINLVPNVRNFLKEIISKETIGRKGYLIHSGLIPLSDKEISKVRRKVIKESK